MDKHKLVQDFANLLGAMEAAATGSASPDDGGSGWQEYDNEPLDNIPGGTLDTFNDYDELILEDGRIIKRYENGSVRVENPTSGVLQEERVDGSLVVSLPNGKVLFQEFRGEPLLVYDTENGGPPGLARVSSAQLPGDVKPKFVFHFQDFECSHLIELESLRYFRVRRSTG